MQTSVLFWRRTDIQGFERLTLSVGAESVTASSTVLCLEDGGFRLDHHWRLDGGWSAQSVTVERWNGRDHRKLTLERVPGG
ncbi:MAG: putative glycolipid-binding domain-containing protein, partial [Aureliella sp.]